MDIQTLLNTLQTVLREHVWLGYFLDLLLKSFFVLALVILVNVFTGRLSASFRHLVWCVGFISLFSLPLFIGLLPKIHVPITTTETVLVENTVTQGIVSIAENLPWIMSAWWDAFVRLYFVLMGLQLSYILLGLIKVYSLHRQAQPVENVLIHQELENLSLEEGLTVSVSMKKSHEVFSPVSWGLFAPEIILPVQAESWDIEKIRNVLIHELSHIQRLDWLTTLVVKITRAIYWYNPLIWYAARKLDEEAEQACDDAVILNGHCHSKYASNLLEIADHARHRQLGNVLVQAIAGSPLGSRVFSILDTSKKRQQTEVVWVVRGLLMGCTVIAVLASLRLVPIVNVTSIDPHASTAFSIIFIPRSEASSFGGYAENLYANDAEKQTVDEEKQAGKSPKITLRQRVMEYHLSGEAAGGALASADAEKVQSDSGDSGSSNSDSSKENFNSNESASEPSLIEDFISATADQDPSEEEFDNYVNEYTSGIIRNVQENLDLNSFGKDWSDESSLEQSELIAINKIVPEYPRNALQRGLEGYSVVEYDIDSSGKVIDPIIVESKPKGVFNRSSIRAIQKYEFEPPKVNGELVSVQGLQTKFVYQLKPG